MIFSKNKKVEKAIADGANTMMTGVTGVPSNARSEQGRRGYNVFTYSQLYNVTGRNKENELQTVSIEQPIFYLTLEERINIFRLSSPVFGLVTSRMNRLSSLNFEVVPDNKNEDMLYERLKNYKQIYKEYEGQADMKFQVARAQIRREIETELPDILPDMSNFDRAILRWKKRLDMQKGDKAGEIADWLEQPNQEDNWGDYIKKYVFDLMIHGSVSQYKQEQNGVIENIYTLPGGTIFPVKTPYVGSYTAYVQYVVGMDPQIFYDNEIVFSSYCPTSARSHGFIPLEALINKVTESMLFDRLMAEQADGTKPPEKMVVITDNSNFGDFNQDMQLPIQGDKQQRIEEKVNQPTKNAVMTFSGNAAQVVDLSRENTMGIQMQRQKDIREEVALVFNASNIEVNLTGSDNTSGRETSETQMELSQGRGIGPIIVQIENDFNKRILPFRFGGGYKLQLDVGQSERESIELLRAKMDTGLFSVNELRRDELNLDPYDGDEFEKPSGPGMPDGTEGAPLYVNQAQ